jgi:biotin operon repressor
MDAHHMGSRWGTVSASVMRRPGLSVAAKTVYAALATYADRAGWIWVRQETIASDLERSRAWVHAAIAELEGQGIVLHDRQYIEGRQRASRYRLRDGLPREARDAASPASDRNDSAVQPADTSHYDESQDSLSSAGGESRLKEAGEDQEPAPVPTDWVPTAADIAWAKARHPDLDVLAFTETFVLSCRAKGYRYSDPSAAWRRWLIEPKGRLPLRAPARHETVLSPHHDQDHRHDDGRPNQRHRGSAPTPGPLSSGAGLAERNADHAAACLERILGRRAAAASA